MGGGQTRVKPPPRQWIASPSVRQHPCVELDQYRNHTGAGTLRQAHQTGPAQERYLAPAPPK